MTLALNQPPTSQPRVGEPLTNWAGNITFNARALHSPQSVEELQDLIAGTDHVRALGSGHSFNRIADTTGDLVSVAHLPRKIEVDPDAATVTVGAGVRYGEVAAHLASAGYALHNLGSLPHISVAGACATGTHGSGDAHGNLATAVSALEMVTADGELVRLSRDTDEEFRGAVVALGALGIVTRMTFDVVPTFDVCQYVYDNLPLEQVDTHFEEIYASGYSVSLFTNWQGAGFQQLWLKRQVDAEADWVPEPEWLGATLADAARHPVPGMTAENATEQQGVAGPWHQRLPHFRLEFTPSAGEELQSEYLVPRADAVEALHAVDEVRDQVAPVLQICEVRTIAADDLWLSASYHRDTVGLHFTWVKDEDRVRPVLGALEDRLARFAARPHWGKLFTMPPDTVQGLYERFPDFQRLADRFDPSGKFRNAWLEEYLPRRR